MPLLRIDKVSFSYPDSARLVIHDESFDVNPGELIQVVGRNGSGKSTLLKLVSGELQPSSGSIVRDPRIGVTYLNQFAGEMLAPDLTIAEHMVAFGRTPGLTKTGSRDRLAEALGRFDLGLESNPDKFVGHLSGGQKQVIALVMSVLRGVQVICLDEFTSNLDPITEAAAIRCVESYLGKQHEVAVLVVAHDSLALVPTKRIAPGGGATDDGS